MSEFNEQDRLHQVLCAYVLGEADAAERSEIEAALARDPALREERDRLAATIGLVKSALGKEEVLSYQATSEVTRAAAELAAGPVPTRRPIAWYQSSSLRAAASIVALVGGSYLGWKAFVTSERADVHMARASSSAPADRDGEVARDKTPLSLGYSGGHLDSSSVLPGRATEEAKKRAESGVSADGGVVYDPNLIAGSSQVPTDAKNDELVEAQLRKASGSALSQRAAGLRDDLSVASKPNPALPEEQPGAVAPDVIYAVRSGGQEPGISVLELKDFDAPSSDPGFQSRFRGETTPPSTPVPAAERPEALLVAKVEATKSTAGGGGGPATPGPVTPGLPALSAPAGAAGGAARPAARGEQPEDALGLFYNDGGDGDIRAREESFDWEVKAGDSFDLETEAVVEEQSEFERLDRFKEGGKSAEDDASRLHRQRRILTPEERQARIEEIIVSCRRLPNERPRDMFFRFWGDNPFEWTANDRQSTFSMDVDTASYTLARKYLVENHLPEKAQIRTEEFVNYFKPDVAAPTPAQGTFAIATELAPNRYSHPMENKWMLRVAVRGREIPRNERAPLVLTLVVDVSGSMKEQQRLELVKHAMRQLVGQLDARDSIAIVAFSADSRLMLPMTSAGKRDLIESAINPLQPDGGTNTEAGLRMGYEQALSALTKNATNRVVLLTDGVANVGIVDPNVITQSVERQRKAGIYLNTIGVGMNNHNDNLLEQLADKGDGVCNYVDDAAEVKRVLVDNFLQALVPIARDAKVQVEFDPAQVESYRLLGYENRAIADRDFRNDKVDAGEINSGHQITALYEIVRTGNLQGQDAPLAKVSVRFKPPHRDGVAQAGSEEASEINRPVYAKSAAASFEATSFGYRRAVLAAQFAEFLRRSVHARGDSLDQLIADAQKLAGERNDQETGEFADMVLKAKGLLDREFANYGVLQTRLDNLRHKSWERARLESLQHEADRARIATIDQEIASLERELREEFDRRRVK